MESINDSLYEIIAGYQSDDWRKPFIETPRLFNYLGKKRYVRPNSDHGYVLFRGERMSGAHVELYSLNFFIKHIENRPIAPFTKVDYEPVIGADYYDPPLFSLTQWTGMSIIIEVAFVDDKFKVYVRRTDYQKMQKKVRKILKANDMEARYEGVTVYVNRFDDEEETFRFLSDLCTELGKSNERDHSITIQIDP